MASFDYSASRLPVRDEVARAHRRAWAWIAAPGSWWTGAERLALVQLMREARDCELCADRQAALSPFAVSGEHDGGDRLPAPVPAAAVDAVHRLTTDPARLTRGWLESLLNARFHEGHYVELLGVLVAALSIDTFHRALGLPLEPLPAPQPGDPDGYRPPGAAADVAWVPMLRPESLTEREQDIFFGAPETANVIRALSLVPDAVRMLHALAAVHYLPTPQVRDLDATGALCLSRPQIELVAARTSALNDCFY